MTASFALRMTWPSLRTAACSSWMHGASGYSDLYRLAHRRLLRRRGWSVGSLGEGIDAKAVVLFATRPETVAHCDQASFLRARRRLLKRDQMNRLVLPLSVFFGENVRPRAFPLPATTWLILDNVRVSNEREVPDELDD